MAYKYSFLKIRSIILYIFNFECAICGKFNISNEVHHIDKNPQNNCPTNLVCVCSDCHKLLHKNISISFFNLPICKRFKLIKLKNQFQHNV